MYRWPSHCLKLYRNRAPFLVQYQHHQLLSLHKTTLIQDLRGVLCIWMTFYQCIWKYVFLTLLFVTNFTTSCFELTCSLWHWKRRLDHITVFSHFPSEELEIDFVTHKKTIFSFLHSLVLEVKREPGRNMQTMTSLYLEDNIMLQNLVCEVRWTWILVLSLLQATLTILNELYSPLSFSFSIDKVEPIKWNLNHQLISATFMNYLIRPSFLFLINTVSP